MHRAVACTWGRLTRYGKKTATMPSPLMMGRMMDAAHHNSKTPIHTPLHQHHSKLTLLQQRHSRLEELIQAFLHNFGCTQSAGSDHKESLK